MKLRLLDLLACPYCRDEGFPLHHHALRVERAGEPGLPEGWEPPLCEVWCSLKGSRVEEAGETPCGECLALEVVEAVLVCPGCGRWFPVEDGIPRMLPDDLRDWEADSGFLMARWEMLPGGLRSRIRVGRP